MFREKTVLAKKNNVYKWAKQRFAIKTLSRKESPWIDSPVNKTFQAQQSVKKIMHTVLWNMKTHITIDLLETDVILNSTSYRQLLRQDLPNLLDDLFINYESGILGSFREINTVLN